MIPRRSCLSVPGSSPRMLAKAATISADEIVIDLEDAVSADAKDAARENVVSVLSGGHLAGRTVAVRINGLDTPWWSHEVRAVASVPGVTTLVVPKVESAGDVDRVGALLDEVESGFGIQVLIETAAGLQNAGAIAAASPRLDALILGYADLRASLGRPPRRDDAATNWWWAQETLLVAARAAGIQAIDGPYLELRDEAGLRRWASHVRELGYDGKWAIHPAQVEPLNEVFAPTGEELDQASAIMGALDRAGGPGAVELDGEMVDAASARMAERILARGGERA